MPLTETLQDNFDVDRLATLWPGSYGANTVTGGRCQVTVDTSYTGIQSDQTYTFNNSFIFFQAFMQAAGGATVEAFFEALIQSGTGGTDIMFNYNAVTGNLIMANRVGYNDAGQVTLAYNATNHRWLRMRITGGNILWDTSPNGITWTNQKTAAASAWATSGTTLYVTLQAHRNNGTNDFMEIDNFNNIPKAESPRVINRAALIRASTR
jgi:hypothetical protein